MSDQPIVTGPTARSDSETASLICLKLGRLVSTPGAIEAMTRAGIDPLTILERHRHGDWGDVDVDDREANDRAARQGGERVLSAYVIAERVKLWVITEADRSVTTLLLPDEY